MMSSWELLALAVLALLVFGPERLPQMARTAGRTIARIRAEANATLDEIKRASEYEELRKSADVSELRELAGELRAEADDLRAQAADVDAAARGLPETADDSDSDRPAPFDPEAT